MPIVFILSAVLSSAASATLNLATFDRGVDLDNAGVRDYVREEDLRGIRLGRSNLFSINARNVTPHGAQVATALLRDLPADRVRFCPIVCASPERSLRSCVKLAEYFAVSLAPPEVGRRIFKKAFEAEFRAYARVIEQGKIRIVNVSVTTQIGDTGFEWVDTQPWLQTGLHVQSELFSRLIRTHPGTLFTYAAGNESREMKSDWIQGVPNAGEPNVLIVGAAHFEPTLASYSNFSPQFVDVLASGLSPSGKGTSIAAPNVGNAVAVDLLAHPNLTIAEARERFLTRACLSNPRLAEFSIDGRYLPGELSSDGMVSVLALAFDGDPSEETFRASLDHRSNGTMIELLAENHDTYMNIAMRRWTRAHNERALEALRAVATDSPTTTTRQRVKDWLSETPGPHALIPFGRDGKVLQGLVIRDGNVTPLDYPSSHLAPFVRKILCEVGLTRPSLRSVR